MENKNTTTTVALTVPTTVKNEKKPPLEGEKKKRGAFHIIKAALFMVKRRSNGKSKTVHVEVASKDMLTKLVGSMRPLHLQNNQSPPRLTPGSPYVEHFEDVFPPPFSPHCTSYSSSSASSSGDSMSRYASATNLKELDKEEESDDHDNDESDKEINNKTGDDMIDVKAEQFIARFYRQMKLQRLESMERYNKTIENGNN